MLEQTLKRFVTLDGALGQLEEEMRAGVLGIKARVFEVGLHRMY